MAERYILSRFAVCSSYFCTLHFAVRRHFVPPIAFALCGSRSRYAVGLRTQHFTVRRFTVGSSLFADRQFALPHLIYILRSAVSQLAARRFTVGSSPFAVRQFIFPHFVLRSSAVFSTSHYLAVPVLLRLFLLPLRHPFSWKKARRRPNCSVILSDSGIKSYSMFKCGSRSLD